METYQYDAVYFILLTLCFAWGGDSTAYFVGRFFGKHKLAPVVSPNKTVEGAVGGVLGSVVLGVAATAIYQAVSGRFVSLTVEVNVKHYLLIALLGVFASILGILGDLFASAIKRQVGLKDYGTIFPGHGGILDRFDSVMFVAPFVAFIVRYFFYFCADAQDQQGRGMNSEIARQAQAKTITLLAPPGQSAPKAWTLPAPRATGCLAWRPTARWSCWPGRSPSFTPGTPLWRTRTHTTSWRPCWPASPTPPNC